MTTLLLPNLNETSAALGMSPLLLTLLIAAVTIWTLTLKGFSLWYSARNHQKRWFIFLLILNTFGILELVYLVWFRKDKREGTTPSLFNNPEGSVSSPSA